jgi:hypothetical protein
MSRGLVIAVVALALVGAAVGALRLGKPGTAENAPRSAEHRFSSGDSASPHSCAAWFNAGTAAALCNPQQLRESWLLHRMTKRGSVSLSVAARRTRSGTAPGLAQLFVSGGFALRPGDRLAVTGTATYGSSLYLRAWDGDRTHRHIGEARFDDLGLSDGGRATVAVGYAHGRFTYVLHRPDGRLDQPDAVWPERDARQMVDKPLPQPSPPALPRPRVSAQPLRTASDLGACRNLFYSRDSAWVCDPKLLDVPVEKRAASGWTLTARTMRGPVHTESYPPGTFTAVLEPGKPLFISGSAPSWVVLLVEAEQDAAGRLLVGEARFEDLRLFEQGTAVLRVRFRDGGFSFTFQRPDGSVIGPTWISHTH